MARSKLEDVTRRTAMQLGLGLVATLFAVGSKADQFSERAQEQAKEALRRQKQYASELQSGQPLKVKYFANDIVGTAHSLSDVSNRKFWITSLALFYGGFCAHRLYSQFTNGQKDSSGLEGFHTPGSRKFSALTTALGAAWDNYTTVQFSRVFMDPKFREYGLDVYFYEGNDTLPAHPSPAQVIVSGVAYLAIAGAFGAGLPAAGSGVTLTLGYVGKNNLEAKEMMLLAFALGDSVAKQIIDGKTQTQIKDYLSGVRANRTL